MNEYTPTIGIEVHAELKTKSKMFCGCKNDPHASEPNQNVCPVCLAHPGTLPAVNKEAVKFLMMVGEAAKSEIADYTEFDRKNYFYPDIPKGYQISQYQFPFVSGGEVGGVALTRIHLEEDTGKSLHDQGSGSIVDFNRAGVPLMELVTEPVIHDAASAVHFGKELQTLLRTLGISDANMEKGEMRVEANISVSKDVTLGTKVEVKNLNSFKAMEQAIIYEVKRQVELLESGKEVVQETRGWDENKSKTFSQRKKETADDYRYFPDPDIPKMQISEVPEFSKSRIAELLPKLPEDKRVFYANLGIASNQIELLVSNIELDSFLQKVLGVSEIKNGVAKLSANFVTSDLISIADAEGRLFNDANPQMFLKLMTMLDEGLVNSRIAKDLLLEVTWGGVDPELIASERGLLQENSEEALAQVIDTIISDNPSVVAEYKAGKEAVLQFLVGQGMKLTKGSANPGVLAKSIKNKILQ